MDKIFFFFFQSQIRLFTIEFGLSPEICIFILEINLFKNRE